MLGIKIPWQVFACAGLGLLLAGFGYWCYDLGQDHKQADWDASIERGRKAVEELKKKQVVITTRVETVYLDKVKVIREKGRDIVKQVPIYIPADSCDLPGGFRLLHDAAATNTLPDSSKLSDAASVSVADATTTIGENYATCQEWREQLVNLQEWVHEQSKLSSHSKDNKTSPE